MIDRLEALHKIGYIHADLKPDNILLLSGNKKKKESSKLLLIDYGLCRTFRDQFGEHLPFRDNVSFAGNLLFASKNAFLFFEQSRRDDMISLLYLLSFFVTGDLAWVETLDSDDAEVFNNVGDVKNKMTPEEICQETARGLLPFAKEIYKYDFYEQPNYAKLKHMLLKYLLAF